MSQQKRYTYFSVTENKTKEFKLRLVPMTFEKKIDEQMLEK